MNRLLLLHAWLVGWCLLVTGAGRAQPERLVLPTANEYLFRGEPEKFYMYVDRVFEGETSKPWQGGAYGLVRSPVRVSGQVAFNRFHEGIDIAPVRRDKAGNPLDLVLAIADGQVVHVSAQAGRSNYGKYIVVAHLWEDTYVYSLYAHLADITVEVGQKLRAGSVLGRMGYTGVGLNRTRAHLHLELCFLLNSHFDSWMANRKAGFNVHGNFNGMNLSGLDVADFFLARYREPKLSFREWLQKQPLHFRVAVPASSQVPDFLKRHPVLLQPGPAEEPNSWEIGFTATGQPVSWRPSSRQVSVPCLIQVKPAPIPQQYLTRGLLRGIGERAELTAAGRQLIELILFVPEP